MKRSFTFFIFLFVISVSYCNVDSMPRLTMEQKIKLYTNLFDSSITVQFYPFGAGIDTEVSIVTPMDFYNELDSVGDFSSWLRIFYDYFLIRDTLDFLHEISFNYHFPNNTYISVKYNSVSDFATEKIKKGEIQLNKKIEIVERCLFRKCMISLEIEPGTITVHLSDIPETLCFSNNKAKPIDFAKIIAVTLLPEVKDYDKISICYTKNDGNGFYSTIRTNDYNIDQLFNTDIE